MIKNKKQLILAISLLATVILLNIPYPHSHTIGASLIIMNIPITYSDGINYLGVSYLFIFLLALALLRASLKKYQGRFIVLAVVLIAISPQMIANALQNNIAKGIYATEYNPGDSNCNFDMIKEGTLQVECELWFENHSRNDVSFTVVFIEDDPFGDGIKSVSLLNTEKPLEVTIEGNHREPIFITEEIDVTSLDNFISGGSTSYVNIIIRDGNRYRKL